MFIVFPTVSLLHWPDPEDRYALISNKRKEKFKLAFTPQVRDLNDDLIHPVHYEERMQEGTWVVADVTGKK
jgi:hypothetical protein